MGMHSQSPSDDSPPTAERIDEEGVAASFGFLANRRRRRVLEVLGHHPRESVERHEIAQQIATDTSEVERPGENQTRRIEISLHHNHLPALEEAELIAYDNEEAVVHLERPDTVHRLLMRLRQ